ncbi:uncharacterized protein LOC118208484 isoform X1 [Anguilla anguilla]|uniref:uncharacterized protein LOC118208484 isoform X1 n=1 Tax=Anguilla anguilla TaxID=7936 RepID=UPI0015AA2DCC|nr:uncharacterized protein LOC118208484 isoform X1 [Anguilla anguilla]
MSSLLQILSLLAIHWTAMGYELGAHGIEGGHLDIRCPYPDGYQHHPKYVCRHPCWKKDVLIRGAQSDVYERSGRFSLYDNSLGRFFTVTIRELNLQDGALYYCGIDKWGIDKRDKVQVTVSKAVDPAVTLPLSAAGSDGNGSSFIRTPGMASTDRTYLSNLSMETATPPLPFIYLDGNKGVTDSLVAIGPALGVLVCLFLAALAVQLKRSVSNPLALKPAGLSVPVDTVQGEEDPEHVYDEYGEMTVYSTVGLPVENSEGGYCTVQFSDLPPGQMRMACTGDAPLNEEHLLEEKLTLGLNCSPAGCCVC